ncbi:hypothetical protein [Mycobacterium interjectum]
MHVLVVGDVVVGQFLEFFVLLSSWGVLAGRAGPVVGAFVDDDLAGT